MSEPLTPEFLRQLAFLAPATEEEMRQFATIARSDRAPAGVVLFREGDKLRQFSIVVSGNVAIEIIGPDRRPRRIHTVGKGELLGWSPVLGSGTMTATARAITDVQLVSLDAAAVLGVCDADPRFGYLFMKRIATAIASRLNSTRLQLLDVFGSDIPAVGTEGARA
jgi:CRP/FNR family transcriptional regulator, cyclic AMP receptor protein